MKEKGLHQVVNEHGIRSMKQKVQDMMMKNKKKRKHNGWRKSRNEIRFVVKCKADFENFELTFKFIKIIKI